jgi:two-component system, chemotaxis family, chemotaxis protein CheY
MAYNVLIVDDSAIVRSVVRKTLGMSGIELGEIHEAGNGRDALAALEQHWIDIVFADINMPVMNGIEMVDRMVERDLLKTSPVVIISTERSETRIEELRARGVSAYLNKPFTPECLRDVIARILEGKTAANAAAAGAGGNRA